MRPVIRYGARQRDVTNLGPGSRAVIWVHGCCFHCEGCIAEAFTGEKAPPLETDPQEMADWVLAGEGCDGLTVSGGEPMLQAEALSGMVSRIRAVRDMGLIVYTGFVYETLAERAEGDPGLRRFLDQIDLLIDGPYIREQDINQPYQGSANQRLLCLTPRYEAALKTYYAAENTRNVEIRLDGGRLILIGVPSADQLRTWRALGKLSEV